MPTRFSYANRNEYWYTMLVIAKTATYGNSRFFHRSNTTVTDDAVRIGERYFPMPEVLGAQVFDVTAERHRVTFVPRNKRKEMLIILSINGLAYLANIGTQLFGFSFYVGLYVQFAVIIFLCVVWMLKDWVNVGNKPYFRRHEYHLALITQAGSEDVISAKDLTYLHLIAAEINRRARAISLHGDGAHIV